MKSGAKHGTHQRTGIKAVARRGQDFARRVSAVKRGDAATVTVANNVRWRVEVAKKASLTMCIIGLPAGLVLGLPFVWGLSIFGIIANVINMKRYGII
jgi:hypothetical protein